MANCPVRACPSAFRMANALMRACCSTYGDYANAPASGTNRLYAVLCGSCAEGLSVIATDVEQHQQETSQHGFAACMAKAKDGDTLCHQGLSTQSLDSTSIFQLCEPCNRVKAKPFGWTSSSLDPAAWQDHKHWPQSPAVVKFHTKRRRTRG